MPLAYLKIDPDSAFQRLDKAAIGGYVVKDSIVGEYKSISDSSESVNGKFLEWQNRYLDWANTSIRVLIDIFSTQREALNFRDASIPAIPLGMDVKVGGLLNAVDARIGVLNRHCNEIKAGAYVKIQVAGGSIVNQTGDNNSAKIEKKFL